MPFRQNALMKSYRLSLPSSTYWQLVRLAADQELKPVDLLTIWIQEAWDHRDEQPRKPDIQRTETPHVPHAIKRSHLADCPAELDRIRALHGTLSIGQIAKELDRPKSTVSLAVKRMGLK